MINPDIDYINFCQRSYDGVPTFIGENGARAYLDTIDDIPTICFPGSKIFRDWFLDLIAIPALELDTTYHIKLGLIPLGFLTAVNDIRNHVETITTKPYQLCGHSLGGVMAIIYGALRTSDGKPPVEIVTFNAPRGLSDQGVDVLANVPIRQYRFGADPVSLVPTRPFNPAKKPIQVGKPIYPDLLENHHLQNFVIPFNNGEGIENGRSFQRS